MRDSLTDAQVEELALAALEKAVAGGMYPSEPRLRSLGARGDDVRIQATADRLIESGAVELPPAIAERWKSNRRRREETAPIRSGRAPAMAGRPRPHDPPARPYGNAVGEYRSAWKRLHTPGG